MFILMALSLWTSRLFLQTLGVDNFGIYNIVGSVMIMFSFLNNALSGSTTRFINFALGKKNKLLIKRTFSTSLYIHLLLCIVILALGETIGLWFVNHELNIPDNRMFAANIVFQISILGTCIGIIGSPFDGVIIAEEKMSVYAYLGIAEALFKVSILLLLMIHKTTDVLISYSFLFFISGIIITFIKCGYCNQKFNYCRFKPLKDKEIFKEMFSFSGWSIVGQISYIASSTGLNMLINIFFGVGLNAAIGIARQVNDALYRFINNFQTAFKPQLIQSYSEGDIINHQNLISTATRLSFILLFTLALPVMLNINYILNIWLTVVPPYTSIFTNLIILHSIIEAISTPLWISMQANGKIRNYQLIISGFHLSTFIISLIFLNLNYAPWIVFAIQLGVQLCIYIFRVAFILPCCNFKYSQYFKRIIFPLLITSIAMIIMTHCSILLNIEDMTKLIAQSLLSTIGAIICIRLFLTNASERQSMYRWFHNRFHTESGKNA